MDNEFLFITSCAPEESPIEVIFAIIDCKDGTGREVSRIVPLNNGLGNVSEISIPEINNNSLPTKIDFLWISYRDEIVYTLQSDIDNHLFEQVLNQLRANSDSNKYLLIGFGHKGSIYLWLRNANICKLIFSGSGQKYLGAEDSLRFISGNKTVKEYCSTQLEKICPINASKSLSKCMLSYRYRYVINFAFWDSENSVWKNREDDDIDSNSFVLEEYLYDCTYDKTNAERLQVYHLGGVPKKVRIRWKKCKSEYVLLFWFQEELLQIFEKSYGNHRETNTDLIIHIDQDKNTFQVSLYRYGLKDPLIISEHIYQYILFKSGFEQSRSENYTQQKGAWVW